MANNGGKWWCMKDRRTHNVNRIHGVNSPIHGQVKQLARIEVKYGPDKHFDLVYELKHAHTDHDTICVRGDYSGTTDFGEWKTEVWTQKGDCSG